MSATIRRPDRSLTDWPTIRDTLNLAEVVTSLLGSAPGRRGERSARNLWWHCPLGTHPDDNPSFSIRPGDSTWHCYGCGEHGDAAALVMRLEGMTFPEAIAYLTDGPAPTREALAPRPRPPERPPTDDPAPPSGMPEADALALVEAAAARLWTTEGTDALTYLHERKLTDKTIRAARLGVVPPLDLPGRPRGVVIPWFHGDRLAHVTIRQPEGREPRYREVFRDPARMLIYPGRHVIRPGRPLVIPEGQFDALLLGQELSDLAAVVTLGSASARPSPNIFASMLVASPWFIATDNDPAGDKAAEGWPTAARRVRPPGSFKDWTDFHRHGVNLRRWWSDRLGGNEAPPLFTWEELAGWRWGPAVGDPEPGIDRPDPECRRAAPGDIAGDATSRGGE